MYSLFKLGDEGVSVDGVPFVKFPDPVLCQYQLGLQVCRFLRSFSHLLVHVAARSCVQAWTVQ